MRFGIKKLFIFLLFATFSPSYALPPASEADKAAINMVLTNFKHGWEKKDVNILKNCFIDLPEDQVKVYQDLFLLINTVELDITVKEIFVNGVFGGAKTTLKKKIQYKMPQLLGQTQVEEKNVNYLMGKKKTGWKILGTVLPDENNQAMRVTDQNMDYVNKQLAKLTPDQRKELLKDKPLVFSIEKNKIDLPKDVNIEFYQLSLNTEQDDSKTTNKVIWSKAKSFLPWVEFPAAVFTALTPNTKYYLKAIGMNKQGEAVITTVLNLYYVKN